MPSDILTKPAPRVMVVGNCHCLPLADALSLCGNVASTEFIDVTFTDHPAMVTKIASLADLDAYDLVFSFPLQDSFGPLATSALRPLWGSRLLTYTNIHFSGLHPDMTYIGAMNRRVPGYFGDYHSKLILFSFCAGRSQEECLALFNGQTYERVGYYGYYAASAEELRQRDHACDVKFAENFLKMVPRDVTMYTFNHPSGWVFLRLADAMAGHAGFRYVRHGLPCFTNHLSSNYIWPVYPEIAEHHKLAYRHGMHFIRAASRGPRTVDLAAFIAGCYAAYEQADFPEFRAMVEKLPFHAGFLTAL